MKKFIKKLIIFFLIFNILLSPIYFFIDDRNGLSHYDLILKYQINKIFDTKYFSIGFFGDSSCGYAIDVNLLNEKSLNLSLTAPHTLCGTLEMIKLSKSLHPELDTVIIMQSLNAFYLETDKCTDVINYQNLSSKNYFKILIGSLINLSHKVKNVLKGKSIIPTKFDDYFENDYVRQGNKTEREITEIAMPHRLNNYNKSYIMEIVDFCTENNLKYLFLIGPSVRHSPNKYNLELLEFFEENEINFEKKYYILKNYNIGDTAYHVHPKYKSESTIFYKNLIDNYFKL